MKKSYVILLIIIAAAAGIFFFQRGIMDRGEQIVSEKKTAEDKIFEDPKFSNPMENVHEGSNWKMLYQNEFDTLENPTECTGPTGICRVKKWNFSSKTTWKNGAAVTGRR